jgi:hypothetical protein
MVAEPFEIKCKARAFFAQVRDTGCGLQEMRSAGNQGGQSVAQYLAKRSIDDRCGRSG